MELSKETLSKTTPISPAKPTTMVSTTHPDLLIRTERATAVDNTESSVRQMIKDQRHVFAEVRRHGIMVPRFYSLPMAPETENGDWNMQTVTQKIEGASLDHIRDLPPQKIAQADMAMEKTYERLLEYYRAQLDANKPALSDIFEAEQWMYGHAKHSLSDSIYLIDTDAFVYPLTEAGAARQLLLFLNKMEVTFQRQFTEARTKYEELFTL